jgi:hypothetical protein
MASFAGAGLGRASGALMLLRPIWSQSFPIIVNDW